MHSLTYPRRTTHQTPTNRTNQPLLTHHTLNTHPPPQPTDKKNSPESWRVLERCNVQGKAELKAMVERVQRMKEAYVRDKRVRVITSVCLSVCLPVCLSVSPSVGECGCVFGGGAWMLCGWRPNKKERYPPSCSYNTRFPPLTTPP